MCEPYFNVSLIVRAKSQDRFHKPQLLKRKESRSGSNRSPFAYQRRVSQQPFAFRAAADIRDGHSRTPRNSKSTQILRNFPRVQAQNRATKRHLRPLHSQECFVAWLSARTRGTFYKIRVDLLLRGVRLWLSRVSAAALTCHSSPQGGRGCLMTPRCLKSQGCHLIPLYYLLWEPG